MIAPQQTAADAGKVLDSLAALSTDLACHCDVPAHTLILPASRVREVCNAIDEAVAALKRILANAQREGHGPVPPSALAGMSTRPTR